jgi:1-deoxy-D-xylulose-5-phosphate synthase
VVFAIDRAGITGDDGPSHHGILDLALLTKVPGMTVFAPSSAQELSVMLDEALSITDGPSAVRYPKGPARQVPSTDVGSGLSARLARRGHDVCILGVGKLVEAAEEAAALLQLQGVSATVWDVRVVKPLDPAMVADAAAHPLVVTAEDGIAEGGAGSSIAAAIAVLAQGRRAEVVVRGVPDAYLPQAKPGAILAELGLDGAGLAATVLSRLGSVAEEPVDVGAGEPVRSASS